jgi:hypothetical protein
VNLEFVGIRVETVDCWRPVGHSLVSAMRRFFIGGSPELEDPTYVAVPSAFEASFMRFRAMMVASCMVPYAVLLKSMRLP